MDGLQWHPSFRREQGFTALALGGVFLLALWLRTSSLDWGLPFRLHPDEWKYVSAGANCHRGEWNPKYFRNPPGFSYLNALWYPLWLQVRTPVEIPEWLGIEPQWLKPNNDVEATILYRPFDLVLGGRALSAFFGALTSVLFFFLARKGLPLPYAMGVAAWTAVSFANVRESHFAVNDAATTCLIAGAMALGLHASEKGRLKGWMTAAVLSGVATAFKYNAFPTAIALLGLRAIRFWKNRDRDTPTKVIRDSAIITGLFLIGFLIVCPFPLIDSPTFFEEIGKLRTATEKPWPGQDTRWAGVQLAESVWISEGTLTTLLAVAGLFVLIRKRHWEWLVFPILYGAMVCSHRLYFVRFSLPLLPWIAIWGAAAIHALIERIPVKQSTAIGLAAGLFALAAVEPCLKDLRSNELLRQTDTRVAFLQWLKTEYARQELVAVDQFAVPLVYRNVARFWSEPLDPRILYIDRLASNELDRLHSLSQPMGIIAVSDFTTLPGILPDSYLERRDALRRFAGENDAIRVFQPFRADWIPKPLDAEDAYSPFRGLWKRERPGAAIEVFDNKSVR